MDTHDLMNAFNVLKKTDLNMLVRNGIMNAGHQQLNQKLLSQKKNVTHLALLLDLLKERSVEVEWPYQSMHLMQMKHMYHTNSYNKQKE